MVAKPPLDPPPVLFDDDPMIVYWNKPVAELVTLKKPDMDPGQAERHRIFSLALMSLVEHYWNGNRFGAEGSYPWRTKQQWPSHSGLYLPKCNGKQADYLGHNICAMAVDGDGDIIDFDFNHNEVFDSSVEHAESRLIRRIFALTRLNDYNTADPARGDDYSTRLTKVTVYTSLESCAQCSGIMTLGKVKEVVYLQKDYGTYAIGNILYNLTHDPTSGFAKPIAAPCPIPGSDFNFGYYKQLDDSFRNYFDKVANRPEDPTKPDRSFFNGKGSKSIAGYLCTDDAYEIYRAAADEFATMKTSYGSYLPNSADISPKLLKTNDQALVDARKFVEYAKTYGSRGTPHQS